MADYTFGYGGSPGDYLYGGNDQLANLSRQQASQSLGYGDVAAGYADPVRAQRGQYQEMLKNLLTNPNGALSNDPTLKFLQNQGAAAVNARNAATGNLLSGGGQVALQDRAQGIAASYIPQLAGLYGQFGGFNTSNPGAAGRSYAEFAARSQNQNQQALAQRNAPTGGTGLPSGGGAGSFGGGSSPAYSPPVSSPSGTSSNFVPYTGTNGTGYFNSDGQYVPSGQYDSGNGYIQRTDGDTQSSGWGNISSGDAGNYLGNQSYQNYDTPDYGGNYDFGYGDWG